MTIRVEHELHQRRRSKNLGVGLILAGFVALVFALTVVKVLQLGNAGAFQAYDHTVRPAMATDAGGTP
jgi:hypothetical protein